MEYIVKLKKILSKKEKASILQLGEIVYESKYMSLIGLNTSTPEQIRTLDFVESIRLPSKGSYQEGEFNSTLIFTPRIKKSSLINSQLVGWGDTRIAVLDSGISSDVVAAECIDYTNTGHLDTKPHGSDVIKIIKHFARGCTLYSAKIGSDNPDELYLMRGLEWAAEKGANIINISSGFENECNSGNCDICTLVNEISKTGIAVVVAAGNEDNLENSILCPGLASLAITVGAVSEERTVADYSSFGKVGGDKPNMLASGQVQIDGRTINGTSFAAPVVSGVIGAIFRKVSTVGKAVEYIYRTLDDLNLPKHQQGLGSLNLEKLVEVVLNETIHTKSAGQDQSS